jgi:hypothetical protein
VWCWCLLILSVSFYIPSSRSSSELHVAAQCGNHKVRIHILHRHTTRRIAQVSNTPQSYIIKTYNTYHIWNFKTYKKLSAYRKNPNPPSHADNFYLFQLFKTKILLSLTCYFIINWDKHRETSMYIIIPVQRLQTYIRTWWWPNWAETCSSEEDCELWGCKIWLIASSIIVLIYFLTRRKIQLTHNYVLTSFSTHHVNINIH